MSDQKRNTPTSRLTTVIRKVTIQNPAQSLQKTSVGLGNLHVDNW